MGIGNGGNYSGSVTTDFTVSFNFELFPFNDAGEPIERIDISGEEDIPTSTFLGAIENFTGRYSVDSSDNFGILEYDEVEIIDPLTLNLTARYIDVPDEETLNLTLLNGTNAIQAFNDSNGDGILNDEIIIESDRIEYILSSPELEKRGIYEFALYVEDGEPDTDGFQLNGETVDITNATTTNIESILDIFSLSETDFDSTGDRLNYRISAASEEDENQILSTEGSLDSSTLDSSSILIEAEDLNLSTYLAKDFSAIRTNDGTEPANATGISLFDADGNEGTASLSASDESLLDGKTLSGIYDLEISYFDENDGVAQIQVLINGELAKDLNGEIVGDDLLLNADTDSGFPTEETRRQYVFEDLLIRPDDEIAIRGIADINDKGSEWARVDFITFDVDTEIIFDASTEL